MKLLARGDHVLNSSVLLTHPDAFYIQGKANPVKGTEYECIGTIIQIINDDCVKVEWRNGYTNHYKDNELSLVEDGDKVEDIGKYNTIW